VKVFKNVLSEQLHQVIFEKVEKKLGDNCWAPSSLFWHPGLRTGIQGSTYQTVVDNDIHDKISKEITHLLPTHNFLIIQHYLWDKNAGIALHNDDNYLFGATIYMNRQWSINDGGIFIHQHENEYKAIVPEFNTMVLNDRKTYHLVTPVSPFTSNLRMTIQVWGR